MQKIVALLCVLMIIYPAFASAETVIRTGKNISVESGQVISGDYYVSVGPLSNTAMSGTVEGDMYAFGGVVTANGVIKSDLTIAGGSAQVYASTSDDVRIIAGEVTIADYVGGDLFVIGGMLSVLSTARIDGDIIFYGGTADIAGEVKGSVIGVSEKMRIDGVVEKKIDIETVESLTLGDAARIGGDVAYTSSQELTRAQNATVAGDIQKRSVPRLVAGEAQTLTLFSLLPLLIALFSSLAVYLLFKKSLERMVLVVQKQTVPTVVVGLCALLFGLPLSVLLMFTGLGLFIGLLSFSFLIFMYILAYTLSGIVLGAYLAKWFTNHPRVTLLWVVAGTLLLQLFLFVPILGVPVVLCVTTLGLGALLLTIYSNVR
jgi:cytoskeletal protein CcmA (bactofilin family)